MMLRLMGKKRGMTRIFDENGNQVVCTVILAEPNVVTQIKKKESDGYEAVQLAACKLNAAKQRNVSKPLAGHFKKAGVDARRCLKETRVVSSDEFQLGQEIGVASFAEVSHVDVQAVSKGKGYQGVMKRHNFAGGPAAHGSSFHRHGGSTGMRTSPGRCLPGQKKAGHMGAEMVSVQNLRVVRIDEQKQIMLVEGAIPGARGSVVYITRSIKKENQKARKKK